MRLTNDQQALLIGNQQGLYIVDIHNLTFPVVKSFFNESFPSRNTPNYVEWLTVNNAETIAFLSVHGYGTKYINRYE